MDRVGSVIPAKWRSFGRQLKFTEGHLDGIDMDERGKTQQCFCAVFDNWSRRCPSPYTWETVAKVLRSPELNEVRIANSMEKWLEDKLAAAAQNQPIEEHVRVLSSLCMCNTHKVVIVFEVVHIMVYRLGHFCNI